MQKSTEEEIQNANNLVLDARKKMEELLQNGKKVHIIWDFDGVLSNSRSDDVFTILNQDIAKFFSYEERLLLQIPENSLWLLPIAHNRGGRGKLCFPPKRFTQDIVTARSSVMAFRVHLFCLSWQLQMRWILFIGHQPKNESYRIIIRSLKDDPDYHVFCVDDSAKHIEAFKMISAEEGMESRTIGIVSPIIRTYTEEELKEYYIRVISADGADPIRIRDPSDDVNGFTVLPGGISQFQEQINALVRKQSGRGHHFELRKAFVKVFGEVGTGKFKTEEELENAMKEFIVGLWC